MMTRLMKHAAVLMVLIVVALCMPLCGMAADYTAGSTTVFYYNENADVMIALLGETIDSYEGMSEFKHDWDGDGTITAEECNENVTIEWFTDAGTIVPTEVFTLAEWPDGTVVISNPEARISGLKAEDNGKTATMKLTNSNGDTFTALIRLYYSGWIHNTPVVTTDDAEYEFVRTEKNHYKLTVADGASVSVDIRDCIDPDYASVRDVKRTIYQVDPVTEERTVLAQDSFLDNQFSDTNDADVYDDEIRFVVSAENLMNYRCQFSLVFRDNRMGSCAIYIDVEIRPTDMSANHTFYYNQNGELSVALLGEDIDAYEGMSEFKRDWNGDGTVTADECNENVAIAWSTTTDAEITPTSGFYTNVWSNGTVVIGNPTAWISGLQPEDDGKTVTMTLTNPNGDVFTGTFYLCYSGWIHNTPVITTDDENFEFEYTGQNRYKLTVADGANVSVDFTDCIDTDYDLVQRLTRTISEIDPATETATVLTRETFNAAEYVDANAAGTEDDELSFTVSAETPKDYRCNYMVIVTENMMIANSSIRIDVEVRKETLTSNVPIYLMTSDNAQELRCLGVMGMSYDHSLTYEEQNAWWEVYDLVQYGQATITWQADNAELDALVKANFVETEPTYLRIRDESMGLDAFLNETITATYTKDGETLGVMNFHIQNETKEMLTWHDPEITPNASQIADSVYDGVYAIQAEVGETVTIKMNYTYSGDINYAWRISGVQQDNATDTYTFTAGLEHDGMVLVNAAGRSDYDSSISPSKFEYTCKFFIEVTEQQETLTSDVTVKLRESETDKQLVIFASDAKKDPSLSAEERYAWSEVLNRSDITYSWTSKDSYAQSIIDKINLPADCNMLMLYAEDGDLSRLLTQTITLTVMADGKQLAQANFHIPAETFEMPTWKDPTTVPAYVDENGTYVITAVEGTTVSIQMNHTYSKPLEYHWYVNDVEIEHSESAYSFTATLDADETKINVRSSTGFIEEISGGHSNNMRFVLNVLPKDDETIALNVQSSHPVVNNVLTAVAGETVTISPNPSCSETDATFVHFWLLGTKDGNGKFIEEAMLSRDSTYSFVATADLNGKYIDYSAGRTGYKPGSFCYQLVIEAPSVDYTLELNQQMLELTEDDNAVLEAVLTPEDGSSILWETSNPAVVQVDQNGQVQAVSAGTAVITASCAGKASDSCQVIVHSSTVLTLPEDAVSIETSAFEGIDAEEIVLPEGLNAIASLAFANNSRLKLVTIPGADTVIAADAFADCPNVTFLCGENSAAQRYAQEQGIPYVLMD